MGSPDRIASPDSPNMRVQPHHVSSPTLYHSSSVSKNPWVALLKNALSRPVIDTPPKKFKENPNLDTSFKRLQYTKELEQAIQKINDQSEKKLAQIIHILSILLLMEFDEATNLYVNNKHITPGEYDALSQLFNKYRLLAVVRNQTDFLTQNTLMGSTLVNNLEKGLSNQLDIDRNKQILKYHNQVSDALHNLFEQNKKKWDRWTKYVGKEPNNEESKYEATPLSFVGISAQAPVWQEFIKVKRERIHKLVEEIKKDAEESFPENHLNEKKELPNPKDPLTEEEERLIADTATKIESVPLSAPKNDEELQAQDNELDKIIKSLHIELEQIQQKRKKEEALFEEREKSIQRLIDNSIKAEQRLNLFEASNEMSKNSLTRQQFITQLQTIVKAEREYLTTNGIIADLNNIKTFRTELLYDLFEKVFSNNEEIPKTLGHSFKEEGDRIVAELQKIREENQKKSKIHFFMLYCLDIKDPNDKLYSDLEILIPILMDDKLNFIATLTTMNEFIIPFLKDNPIIRHFNFKIFDSIDDQALTAFFKAIPETNISLVEFKEGTTFDEETGDAFLNTKTILKETHRFLDIYSNLEEKLQVRHWLKSLSLIFNISEDKILDLIFNQKINYAFKLALNEKYILNEEFLNEVMIPFIFSGEVQEIDFDGLDEKMPADGFVYFFKNLENSKVRKIRMTRVRDLTPSETAALKGSQFEESKDESGIYLSAKPTVEEIRKKEQLIKEIKDHFIKSLPTTFPALTPEQYEDIKIFINGERLPIDKFAYVPNTKFFDLTEKMMEDVILKILENFKTIKIFNFEIFDKSVKRKVLIIFFKKLSKTGVSIVYLTDERPLASPEKRALNQAKLAIAEQKKKLVFHRTHQK